MRFYALSNLAFLIPLQLFAAGGMIPPKDVASPGQPEVQIVAKSNQADSALTQEEACRDLKPGESRSVNDYIPMGKYVFPRNYLVTRNKMKTNEYDVELPVDFVARPEIQNLLFGRVRTPSELRDGLDGDVIARFVHTANECFKKYQGRLADPDGNVINLKVKGTTKNRPNPIDLQDKSFRANSANWNVDLDCSAIVHESAHLTGLVDSYAEAQTKMVETGFWPFNSTKTVTEFNCRKTLENNIMADHAVIGNNYVLHYCACEDASCAKEPSRFEETSAAQVTCPQGYNETAYQEASEPQKAYVLKQKNFLGKYEVAIFRKLPWQPMPLLTRSQFRLVTKPNCTRDNSYVACNQNTFHTKEIEGCVKIPERCDKLD